MNLEKLGLLLFIKYMRQFDQVKSHLLASARELLMAFSATLQVTNQITTDNFFFKKMGTVDSTFKKIDSILQYSIVQLGSSDQSENQEQASKLKNNVVESIIEVIEEEIDRINETSNENRELKIEALLTVKSVLCQHLRGTESTTSDIIEMEKAISA